MCAHGFVCVVSMCVVCVVCFVLYALCCVYMCMHVYEGFNEVLFSNYECNVLLHTLVTVLTNIISLHFPMSLSLGSYIISGVLCKSRWDNPLEMVLHAFPSLWLPVTKLDQEGWFLVLTSPLTQPL